MEVLALGIVLLYTQNYKTTHRKSSKATEDD